MTDQLVEAAGEEQFDAAVTLTTTRWSENHAVPLEDVAAHAVAEIFCICVTEAGDEMEHHLSSLHAGLVSEVIRRARGRLNDSVEEAAKSAGDVAPPVPSQNAPGPLRSIGDRFETRSGAPTLDVVDVASDESFPASDSPAWINR